jgi:uncharacterized protein
VRVVVDTNLWISFLFGKRVADLLDFIETNKIEILISRKQIEEIEAVLLRPKIRKLAKAERIAVMRRFLKRRTQLVTIHHRIKVCRDPNDDFLLELAVSGRADCLVTGDESLLILDPFRSIRIVPYHVLRDLLKK